MDTLNGNNHNQVVKIRKIRKKQERKTRTLKREKECSILMTISRLYLNYDGPRRARLQSYMRCRNPRDPRWNMLGLYIEDSEDVG